MGPWRHWALLKGTNMMIKRSSRERGHADHGWLNSYHSFSFADYDDPADMGYRSLRVINEDIVQPSMGFPLHPHRDMEIITYVISGQLQHHDSMGNGSIIHPGEIQTMSAGTGIRHSEFNASNQDPVHLLQIWIHPEKTGLTPGYAEWKPAQFAAKDNLTLIVSPDGAGDSAQIAQDARIYLCKPAAGESLKLPIASGRGIWVQVSKGTLTIDGLSLQAGDAATLEEESLATFESDDLGEALVFDLK